MSLRRMLSEFDYLLLLGVLTLAMVGLLGIYSAGLGGSYHAVFLRQLLWVSAGVLALSVILFVDYHFLLNHSHLWYGGGILLLLGVLFFGAEIKGNKSWIYLFGVGGQPSELVKIAVILALAHYLGESRTERLSARQCLMSLGLVCLPAALVVLQGDVGTALTYGPILVGMLLVVGLPVRYLVFSLGGLLLTAPLVWVFLKDYQRLRILATFFPGMDPQGIGYQTRQSLIAIGSGGLGGKGFGAGLQSQLGFVPEIQTDFIFALLAEEGGFLGGALILLLYALVLYRLLSIAETARERAGVLVVVGITSLLLFHLTINVGMTLGLVPTIGIPLPLLSYGGSATLTTFIALGLALNIRCRRFVY